MTKGEKLIITIFSVFYLTIFVLEFLFFLFKIKIPKLNLKKIIIINLSIVLFGVIFLGVLSHVNFLDYEKPIPYSEYNRIGFKNFRGLELFKKEFHGNKYFAYVVTTIEIDDNKNTVTAYFHPSKSFVYNKKSASTELLTHELYHFKITEYFARKTRKEIIEKKITSFEDKKNILGRMLISEREFQNDYDYETYHSYVYSKQKEFEKRIDSLLTTLNKYKKPELK